jgi:hypothetical protein
MQLSALPFPYMMSMVFQFPILEMGARIEPCACACACDADDGIKIVSIVLEVSL